MSTTPDPTDVAPLTTGAGEGPPRLASTLVRYDERPDRRTVYRPGLGGVPRMSTWLTADADCFVDLQARR